MRNEESQVACGGGERVADHKQAGVGSAFGVTGVLRALGSVLDREAVVAIAARGRKVRVDDTFRPISTFRIGSRAAACFRPAA